MFSAHTVFHYQQQSRSAHAARVLEKQLIGKNTQELNACYSSYLNALFNNWSPNRQQPCAVIDMCNAICDMMQLQTSAALLLLFVVYTVQTLVTDTTLYRH